MQIQFSLGNSISDVILGNIITGNRNITVWNRCIPRNKWWGERKGGKQGHIKNMWLLLFGQSAGLPWICWSLKPKWGKTVQLFWPYHMRWTHFCSQEDRGGGMPAFWTDGLSAWGHQLVDLLASTLSHNNQVRLLVSL